uniref:THAP-type domain-containing protein n=1 Tax=Photinus pyralis TaxID=7054 RepID=A0A1Y1KN14_PHOPY
MFPAFLIAVSVVLFKNMEQQQRTPKKCCVPQCNNKWGKKHRFPVKNAELCKLWKDKISNPALASLSDEAIYKSYRVCDVHFREDVKTGGKRGLLPFAYPTLFLSTDADANTENVAPNIEDETHAEVFVEPARVIAVGTSCFSSLYQFKSPVPVKAASNPNIGASCSSDASIQMIGMDSIMSVRQGVTAQNTLKNIPAKLHRKKAVTLRAEKRGSLLKEVNVTRQNQLTVQAKHFYRKVVQQAKQMQYLEKKLKGYQERLAAAEALNRHPDFQLLMKYVNTPTYNFIMAQVKNQLLTPKRRRYTIEQKILALTLLKASSKGYRLLSKLFALPSRVTLRKLLQKLPLKAGLNKSIFTPLKDAVVSLKVPEDRYCILLFDEMAIDTNLQYKPNDDCIEGVEDFGDSRTPKLANTVNVFMLKGARRTWKQPIVFTFTSGPIKQTKLKELIVAVIKECDKVGLQIIATVCDQGSANQATIHSLINDNTNRTNSTFGFIVDGKERIPLFDTPHLFKGLRNNLLTKNLHFVWKDINMVAKWEHIKQLYYLDTADDTRLCNKLTDSHVLPEKINKMKVSSCTQVFSHRVGSLMKRISRWDTRDEPNLPVSASETAEFILFADKLFDSLNGTTCKAPVGKPLKGGVSASSGHVEFWYEALQILDSMKFYSDQKNGFVANPSLRNLKHTIRGFIYLQQKLLNEGSFSFLLPRSFNQDALENFFGSVRSHGIRNINPSVHHFITSFKTLIINNFMSSHSMGQNCEEDVHVGALDTLRLCLEKDHPFTANVPVEAVHVELPAYLSHMKKSRVARGTIKYFTGYMVRKIKKNINHCEACKNNFYAGYTSQDNDVIEASEYAGCQLVRPGDYITYVTNEILSYIFYLLPRICHVNNISMCIYNAILPKVSLAPLNCPQHDTVSVTYVKLLIRVIIHFWCKQINRIAKGKDAKFITLYNANRNVLDPLKIAAHQRFLNNSKRFRKK